MNHRPVFIVGQIWKSRFDLKRTDAFFQMSATVPAVVNPSINPVGFEFRRSEPAGFVPCCVVTGDFNTDGKLDFIVANAGDNTLWEYLGKGDETFALPVIIPIIQGQSPVSLAAADLRGNGKLDLVVSEADTNSKETDRKWEEGEDPSVLDFTATEYGRTGKVLASEEVKNKIREFGINKCARESGFDRKDFVRKLVRDLPVKRSSYVAFVRWMQRYRTQTA